MVEFIVNSKTYTTTKALLSMVNYKRELRMEADVRRGKVEKVIKFVERIKKIHEKARAVLRKI